MKKFQTHHARQDDLVEASRVIMATAEAKGRDLTPSELKRIKVNATEFDKVKALIDVGAMIADQEAELKRRPRAKAVAKGRLSGNHGFHGGFGDFAMAVKNAGMLGGATDGRLKAAAASTFGSEGSGTDGGFAIPPDFREAIMEKAFGEDSLISRTDRQVISGNSLTFPASMTTPWGTTGAQRIILLILELHNESFVQYFTA